MSNIAKISVEKHESKEQFLYDLDKSKSLCEIVRDICKKAGLVRNFFMKEMQYYFLIFKLTARIAGVWFKVDPNKGKSLYQHLHL